MLDLPSATPTLESPLTTAPDVIVVGVAALVVVAQQCGLQVAHHATLPTLAALLADYQATDVMVVVLAEQMATALLLEINDLCQYAGVRWLAFHIEMTKAWLGPAILPGQSATYHDLLARRLCTMDDSEVFDALVTEPTPPTKSCLTRAELGWMMGVLVREVEAWRHDNPCCLVGVEWEADPTTLTLSPHPILPLPTEAGAADFTIAPPFDRPSLDLLVSERCGIVVRTVTIEHHASVPAALTTVQAHVAHQWWQYPSWHNDATGVGSTFNDPNQSWVAAIAEATERYGANALPLARPIHASYNDLHQRGDYVLDPDQLALFTPDCYARPDFPFALFTRNVPIHWVRGWSLTTNRAAWIPLNLTYVNWQMGNYDQPFFHDPFYPGISAGTTLEQAIVGGLEEVIERDTMMIWWLNRPVLPALHLPSDVAALWHGIPTTLGQNAWMIPLPNEFEIPVVAGVVYNAQEQLLNIGFACRPDPLQAGLKAWTEALTLQEGSRDLLDPDGRIWGEVAAGTLGNVFQAWRTDRRYTDSFRADFRDLTEQNAHQQFFLDPRAIEHIRSWVMVEAGVTLDELLPLPNRSLSTYQKRIEAKGHEIFYVDLTPPDIARAGLRVVRVLVPGLVPDFPAAFPHLGNGRIQQMAVALGWCDGVPTEMELNFYPIPHA